MPKGGLFSFFNSKREEEPVGRPKKPGMKKVKPEDVIIAKLKKGNKQAVKMPQDELREWAKSLCVPDELKEWYLNPEFAATKDTFDRLEKLNAKLVNSNSKKSGGLISSTSEGSYETRKDDEAFNDIDFDFDAIEGESKNPYMKVGKTVKIKLVIAEICKSDAQKAIRKMLSPVLTKIDSQQQFGMFHSALVVGPWYLEWNNSSLCIPRKCYSSAAMLAADLDFGNQKFTLDETIKKISKVIIDWNVNKTYNQRKYNCQQFIDELCGELGIKLMEFKGPLGKYLSQLREKGRCEIAFPVSDDMREKLKIRDELVKFQTHQEIDQFIKDIQEVDPQFEDNYPLDWLLLKSFDRAFWLRHFKHPNDKKYTPHSKKCPFKDPTQTASFKKEWF